MKKLTFAIGNKMIGGDNPCLIQSMGDIKTTRVEELVKETNELASSGLDMMRFSILDKADIEAIGQIKKQTNVPIIADIHFDYTFALAAIDAGVDKIRINPGNIGTEDKLRTVIHKAKEHNIPIRIGVNSGSLNKYRGKTGNRADDILLALDETMEVFKQENFDHIVLSLKSSDPKELKEVYEKAYDKYPYPLHLGLTESGFSTLGVAKSSVAVFPLLVEGIGDTLRISLADDRIEEIRACKTLLRLAGRRNDLPDMVVCPSCGRTQIDLKPISREVQYYLDHVFKPVQVAVMGCPVNGIGEAKNADFGIAGSGAKDLYVLFAKGKEIGLYQKEEALAKLYSLIEQF
jgi:(E)-4-hydroxy-3-methylbut-2-enyl-diphosphate synthase